MIEFASAQNTFYIVGIIYMIFMMLIAIAFLVVLITIAMRIKAMQKRIKDKIDSVSMFAKRGKSFWNGFRRGINSDQ